MSLSETYAQGAIVFFVRLPRFHGVALVIYSFEFCEKTRKLEKKELVFLLC
jgi:hypothetical protein